MANSKLTTYVSKMKVLAFEIKEVSKTIKNGSGAILIPKNSKIDTIGVNDIFLSKFNPVKGDFYVIEPLSSPKILNRKTFLGAYSELKKKSKKTPK